LAAEAAARGWPALHADLAIVDPITAARLQPQDSQRISRALEVFRVSGQPLSFFQRRIAATPVTASEAQQSMAPRLPRFACNDEMGPSGLLISLEPNDRAWLHSRIAERFDAMLASGFLDEVRALRARGDLNPDLPSMRCVGYRQAWTLLDGLEHQQATETEKLLALRDFREKGIAATRQLAKRQLTWLRSMPQRRVVSCDAPDALPQVLKLVKEHVGGLHPVQKRLDE